MSAGLTGLARAARHPRSDVISTRCVSVLVSADCTHPCEHGALTMTQLDRRHLLKFGTAAGLTATTLPALAKAPLSGAQGAAD